MKPLRSVDASMNEIVPTLGGLNTLTHNVTHWAVSSFNYDAKSCGIQPTFERECSNTHGSKHLGHLDICHGGTEYSLCSDCWPVLQLMLFSYPHWSLQSIWSTQHFTLTSSHSIPRCHDLRFQRSLSQPLARGFAQGRSTAGHLDIPRLRAHLKPEDGNPSLRVNGLGPAAHWPSSFLFNCSSKWRRTHSGRNNSLLSRSDCVASNSYDSTPT